MKINLLPENLDINLEMMMKRNQGIEIMFPKNVMDALKGKKLKAVFDSYPVYKKNGLPIEMSCEIKPNNTRCYNIWSVNDVIKQIGKKLKNLYDNYSEDMVCWHEFGDLHVEELTVDTETGIFEIGLGS